MFVYFLYLCKNKQKPRSTIVMKRIYDPAVDTCLLLTHEDLKKRYDDANSCLYLNTNYQILWFKKELVLFIESRAFHIEANSICLISPHQLANFLNERVEDIDEYAIFLPENFLKNYTREWGAFIKHHLFCSKDGFNICTINSDREFILNNIVEEINKEQHDQDSFTEQRLTALVNLFFIDLCRYGKWTKIPIHGRNSQTQDLFVRFIDCVENNYCKYHSVTKYAEILGVSVALLYQEVKRHSNKTPYEIIKNKIITEAKHELTYGTNDVKIIAFSLGFSDTSNFIKLFKNTVGISPLEYRKTHNK